MTKAAALLAGLFPAGCQSWHLGYYAQSGQASQRPAFGARVSVDGSDRVVTGIVAGVLIAEGVRHSMSGEDPGRTGSELDPGRAINVQDCTRAVDPQGGNLMCR